MTTPRFGFCCKWIDDPSETNGAKNRELNLRTTTMRWLRENKSQAEDRQWELMNHNAAAALRLIEKVGAMPEGRRMLRLGSDMLSGYTEPSWIDWWQQREIQDHCERLFKPLGDAARRLGVRLSFHPGQFCVLASESDEIVERSILEFEYHTDMARWMGFGQSWHDEGFKINIHLSGKGGASKFMQTLAKLSPEARNLITIENDEVSNGLDSILPLAEHCALVLDIHHHWVKTGEYIDPADPSVMRCVESWRGRRPVLHFSTSREDILVGHDRCVRPDLAQLLAGGHKKQQLRAHSDFYWNDAVNDWAMSFADNFDIQCEAKGKNIATERLYERFITRGC